VEVSITNCNGAHYQNAQRQSVEDGSKKLSENPFLIYKMDQTYPGTATAHTAN